MCDDILDTIDKTLADANHGIMIYDDNYIKSTYPEDIASIHAEYDRWTQSTQDNFKSQLLINIESYIAEYLFRVFFDDDIFIV